VALARAAQIGQIPVNLTATVNANVNANVNLGFVAATYLCNAGAGRSGVCEHVGSLRQ
jgi:hypothetical protein